MEKQKLTVNFITQIKQEETP